MLSKLRHLVFVPLALLLIGAATSGCQPTGHPRCDAIAFGARTVIEDRGYRVDCDPGFSSWTGTRYTSAWTEPGSHTVWVWPDSIRVLVNGGSTDALLLKTLWHEAGHTTGLSSECDADQYAYKHMKPAEREGVGFIIC